MERFGSLEGWSTTDPNAVIDRVTRIALEECLASGSTVPVFLEACVRESVEEVDDGPVKAFVPLLALRRVRCCILAGSCDCGRC